MGRTEDQDVRAEERATTGPPKWSADPQTPPPYDKSTSVDKIRSDIDHTRAEMDETIDALSARLEPRAILDEALSWMGIGGHAAISGRQTRPRDRVAVIKAEVQKKAREAAITGGKAAGKSLWRAVKRHPLPAAMIVGGVVWAFFEGGKRPRRSLLRYVYNPEPEHSGSYVDARTGKAYHNEDYGHAVASDADLYDETAANATGGVRNPRQFGGAHIADSRESRWPEEDLAAEHHGTGTGGRQPHPQPDPSHSGSYVDARTGEPYDKESYGQETRATDEWNPTQNKEGQR